ncbi:hypothetical protein Naga_100389g2 [Nannochloropsis gaditana]|uniref:DNA polymerase alpha subunit B n=1 Tax=Nannochloropsis gaditana TaxID=72520 RepID=W7TPC9_9STRA|nr:hypothetical protein Naga_100389g2 [Nannochloropsis gaditana]
MTGTGSAVKEGEVLNAFQEINEDLHGKAEVVEKCLSIIHHLGLSARDLANEWEAHAMNRGSDDSSQALLNLSSLGSLEATLSKRGTGAGGATVTPAASTRRSGRASFDPSTLPSTEQAMRKRLSLSEDPASAEKWPGAGAFLSPSPSKAPVKRRPPSSDGAGFMSPPAAASFTPSAAASTPAPMLTPGGLSSTSSPPLSAGGATAYLNRTNAGQKAGTLPGALDINLPSRYRFMYTTLEERARAQEKMLLRLQDDLVARGLEAEAEVTPVGVPKQETVTVIGRVCCEAPEGRINKASVLLEGSRRDSGGFRVKLELGQLPAFSLFPGQVVAVEGVNSSGFKMVVRRIIEGIPRPFLTSPAKKMLEFQHDSLYQGGGALSLLVAAGPYTTTDSLEYEPLEDLLKVIAARQPDVAVLCGPFVDANHPQVASGETEIAGAGEEKESVDFESLFKMRVSLFLEGLYDTNPTLASRIVLVPSLNDVFHDHPPLADRIPGGVPSPWFEEERLGDLGLPFASEKDGADKRLYCLSNPSFFTVNEVAVGVTTNDILCHLSGDEVSYNPGNRLARLAAHLLQQQSFFPLFPPPADGQAQLDLRHADHLRMPITPDVLLLPSKLTPFVKDVGGALCINPGTLTKGGGGGTYAMLHIHPLPAERLERMSPETEVQHEVARRTHAEIVRI